MIQKKSINLTVWSKKHNDVGELKNISGKREKKTNKKKTIIHVYKKIKVNTNELGFHELQLQ
jgi:hypothetical protein